MDFMYMWGLYAFIILVPIIVLYLLKPKPKEIRIPSVMFIMQVEQKRRFRSFFKKIIRDPILIIQILAVCALVLALANPFYVTEEVIQIDEDVAIVLDVSASMQSGGRFNQAKEIANLIISQLDSNDKVTLILAENIPVVLLRRGEKIEAEALVRDTYPKATSTGLGGAMLLASDIIKESKVDKKIYVISDFSSNVGMDPQGAQKQAFAKGISVEFLSVEGGKNNVAIISSRSGRSIDSCYLEVLVKNYGSEKSIGVKLTIDGREVDSLQRTISEGSSDVFGLSGKCTSSEHEAMAFITDLDDLDVDNYAYAIITASAEIDVLLIRERESEEYIRYALDALSGVAVSESYPPIYPQSYEEYEVVIFQEAETHNILAGTFPRLKNYVDEGGNLIVLGFEYLGKKSESELSGIVPVEAGEVKISSGNPSLHFDHEMLREVDIEEILVKKHLKAEEKIGTITLASMGGDPVITYWDMGNGGILYLGIVANSTWSDFYLKPSFPIFWNNILNWITRNELSSNIINFKTGEQLPILSDDAISLRTPSGKTMTGTTMLLDEAGFYQINGAHKLAVSLLDDMESDIEYRMDLSGAEISTGKDSFSSKEEIVNELFTLLALLGLCLVILEWFYYKRRGSL
jgi:hypothetical protein